MSLTLNRGVLAATYDLLRETAPYTEWDLPPSSQISFKVIKSKLTRGTFQVGMGRKRPIISVSEGSVGRLGCLIETMAHEMVHLHEDTNHAGRGDVMHSKMFWKLAQKVCDAHGMDMKMF